MKRYILILFVLFFSNAFSQQKDSVLIDKNFQFEDGLYIDFTSVKHLNPVSKASIITNIPINDIEFFKKLTKKEFIEFYDNNGVRQKIETKNIWGYAHKGTLYKNSGEGFFRIPVVASISQYIAEVKVLRESMNDPYMSGYYYGLPTSTTYETKEAHTFIISFETGIVYEYNYKNLEQLLSTDTELFQEYSALKKRDKKRMIFLYIRKYNEKHPLYFYK